MKRLLCILSSMNAGGAETFLMKLYRNLDKTRFQMDFCINVKEKCFYEDEILSLGGRIFRIPSKSENVKEFKKQLSEVVKNNNYTNVLRITSNAAGFLDLKIAKKAGAKVTIVRSSNSSDGTGIKSRLAHRLGRFLFMRYVDVKIAPSDLAAKYTFGNKAYNNGEVKILHNGLDIDAFKFDEEARDGIRKELQIRHDAFVVGHVGRFEHQKNHDFLIDIFAGIKKKKGNAVLLLVGDGSLKEKIKTKVDGLGLGDSVCFAGVRSDVTKCLSAMDVFVFPSFYEGMPNTVIEAQASGLPCVIADTITKEADVTESVKYLSLKLSSEAWADSILSYVGTSRAEAEGLFIMKGYDIDTVCSDFNRTIWGGDLC